MTSLQEQLTQIFSQALVAALGSEFAETDPLVVPASNPKFGDYQCNVALPLAKKLKQKPREIAQQILEKVDVAGICLPPEIAGPGFINLAIAPEYLQAQLQALQNDPRLGVRPTPNPQRIIVDFSSPNIAKEMHEFSISQFHSQNTRSCCETKRQSLVAIALVALCFFFAIFRC